MAERGREMALLERGPQQIVCLDAMLDTVIIYLTNPSRSASFEDALKHVPSVGPMPKDKKPAKPRRKKPVQTKR
jgi:hypothetical protein